MSTERKVCQVSVTFSDVDGLDGKEKFNVSLAEDIQLTGSKRFIYADRRVKPFNRIISEETNGALRKPFATLQRIESPIFFFPNNPIRMKE